MGYMGWLEMGHDGMDLDLVRIGLTRDACDFMN